MKLFREELSELSTPRKCSATGCTAKAKFALFPHSDKPNKEGKFTINRSARSLVCADHGKAA